MIWEFNPPTIDISVTVIHSESRLQDDWIGTKLTKMIDGGVKIIAEAT